MNEDILKTSFPEVKWLHENGLSLIPVRDKAEGDYQPKTPYKGWRIHQKERLSLPILWGQMDTYNTNAVAIICGEVSGNLEIIDIDVKYKPGIDATIFMALRGAYPDLYNRLRIHKTPSGGYHILYRVATGVVPGNQKLAGREKSEEELKAQARPRVVNFIETRGEAGYALAPPSAGYSVFQDVSIPTITWAERCSIEAVMRSLHEIVEREQVYKPKKADNDYYDENPFEHFNNSPEAEDTLEIAGWKKTDAQSSVYNWYTRPGKDKGISASFNKRKRIFFVFTSSTELEEQKGYFPAVALSKLLHGDDRKKTFAYLVQKGYGRIKQKHEQRLVHNKAIAGKPLPANASTEAKTEHSKEIARLQATYPYGIFWELNEDGHTVINREKLYNVADGLGFKLHNEAPVRIDRYIVRHQTERAVFDELKAYIKEEDQDEYMLIANSFESFIQKNGSFTISRLQFLPVDEIVKDSSNTCYKFYNNGYLYITGTEYSFRDYESITGLIWEHSIMQRAYNQAPEGGRYVDFLNLATPYSDQQAHIRKCIGYLAHQFKDETTAYIVVLTEQCPDPKQGGGSGKNIFSSLFAQTTTYKSIPGDQVSFDTKFMQAMNGERIFAISDAPRKFNFMFLKEPSSGSAILEKKFKDQRTIEVEDMPKFLIQTNYSYEVTDGGLRRRIIGIEFTDFFTKAGGVDVHFGCHFPKGWSIEDWQGFDNFIAGCIRDWIAGGNKLHPQEMTTGGWHKQFEQTWGAVITNFIEQEIEGYCSQSWVSNDQFKKDLETYYQENSITINYRPAMQRIVSAFREYSTKHNIEFLNDQQRKNEAGQNLKYKFFGKQGSVPF